MRPIFNFFLYLTLSFSAFAQSKLQQNYDSLRAKAVKLAGTPDDIPQRIVQLRNIYLDSDKKHTFSLLAAHGANWGKDFFEWSSLMTEVGALFFLDSEGFKKEIYTFAWKFKDANRNVFIDTYTNYYFSKIHGREKGAEKFIRKELLDKLNHMHTAKVLTEAEKRDLFEASLLWEQEITVSPRVKKAVDEFKLDWMIPIILSPTVQFSYFPADEFFYFNDFSEKEERIYYGMKAYDIAVQVGWKHVWNKIL